MQLVTIRETFDGCDLVAFVHHRERQTRIESPSVHQHGAGAALAVIASFFRASKLQPLPQCVEQRHARINIERVLPAVNV